MNSSWSPASIFEDAFANRFRFSAFALCLIFTCGLAGLPASAQYVGGSIPIVSTFSYSSSVTVSDTNPVISAQVTLVGLSHGRSGDLHVILGHSDTNHINIDLDLFSRPGVSPSNQYGALSSTSGNYSFADSAPTTFSAAAVAAGNGVVPNGTYHPSEANLATGVPILSYLSIFRGDGAAGTWTLSIGDSGPGIDGSLDSWQLDLVTTFPKLNIFLSNSTTAVLAWSTNPPGFFLQSKADLSLTNWLTMTNPVIVVNGSNQVAVSPLTGASYYRLAHP